MHKVTVASVKIVFLLTLLFCIVVQSFASHSPSTRTQNKSVFNSLSIGSSLRVSLFGYTSPSATVSMVSTIDLATTLADPSGYFRFDAVSIPATTSELCFYAADRLGRISQPSCIAFFPSYAQFDIGPLLLSPTLSLSASEIETSKSVVISGSANPKAKVQLFYSQDSMIFHRNTALLKKPLALTTETDSLGNFSLAFSSNKPTDGRVYAQSYKNKDSSAKSSSLSVSFLPYWVLWITYLFRALQSLSKDILLVLFLLEAVGIILLLYFLLWKRNTPKALMIVEDSLIKASLSLSKRITSLQKR